MVFYFRLLVVFMIARLSLQIEFQISYDASSNAYQAIPAELQLINVAVFTRHGDRAQITRVLSPLHPENANITSFWRSKLPMEKFLRTMARSATPLILEEGMSRKDLISSLYNGLDHSHSPYAQLTELGASQLFAVGRELRTRYVGTFLPEKVEEASSGMFCRSTNICRTVQSLRSLLAGMYGENNETLLHILKKYPGDKNLRKRDRKLPNIYTRNKATETMFPHADGPCLHMSERRVKLYHQYVNSSAISRWGTLEKRMIDFIGSKQKRIGWLTWLNILDVYTCFHAHSIPFPLGINFKDLEEITELVAWTWDVLYADDMLSRLAIGRFIRESVDNMDAAVNYSSINNPSGGDSTIFSRSGDSVKASGVRVLVESYSSGGGNSSGGNSSGGGSSGSGNSGGGSSSSVTGSGENDVDSRQMTSTDDPEGKYDPRSKLSKSDKITVNRKNTELTVETKIEKSESSVNPVGENDKRDDKNGPSSDALQKADALRKQAENPREKQGVKHDDISQNTYHHHIAGGTKMLIYSGHDSTMVPLLRAIGLYHGDWPPYASYLTLETAILRPPSPSNNPSNKGGASGNVKGGSKGGMIRDNKGDPKGGQNGDQKAGLKGGAVPGGVVGQMYVRAVYNDRDRVMLGCGGAMWCPYEMFRAQMFKWSITHAEYVRECRNPIPP